MKRRRPTRPHQTDDRDEATRSVGPAAHVGTLSADIERQAYRQRLETFFASRDAAASLTADSLKLGIRLRPVVEAAADVAHFADEALAIVHDEYHPHLDCQEGCHYCCCKPGVLVSVPEFLRILINIHST